MGSLRAPFRFAEGTTAAQNMSIDDLRMSEAKIDAHNAAFVARKADEGFRKWTERPLSADAPGAAKDGPTVSTAALQSINERIDSIGSASRIVANFVSKTSVLATELDSGMAAAPH